MLTQTIKHKDNNMQNQYLVIEEWMCVDAETGRWIIDELIFDPRMDMCAVARDGGKYYLIGAGHPAKATPLSSYRPRKSHPRASFNHHCLVWGVIPRQGFAKPQLGRAMTGAEFDSFCAAHGLTDADISDPFEQSSGMIFGTAATVSATYRQVRVNGNPVAIERSIKEKGIESVNGVQGRLNIRVA